MKATLIFPGINLGGWNSFSKAGANENFVPYGLAYIAAYAKSCGHVIDLIDLRRLTGWGEFDAMVKDRAPGVFGISSMSVDFSTAAEAARRIKNADKLSTVVLGGVHATVASHEVELLASVDHIISGEGEISFSNLLSSIEAGVKCERIIRGIPPDIRALPYPDRDLFSYRDGESAHPWLSFMEGPFVSIIAGRGCPFSCAFCQPAERLIFGGRAKVRDTKSIIDELRFLQKEYSFKSLLIHDDLFTLNASQVLDFCAAYREAGFPPSFTCQARVDFIVNNESVVAEMVRTGLKCFMIGFESGSQRVLDYLKKGTTVEQNLAAAAICEKYGIKVFANYMFGVPSETRDEVRRTVQMIRRIRPAYASPCFFTPYPGTELGDYCIKNSLLSDKSDSYYNRAANTEGKLKGIDYNFLKIAVKRSLDYEKKSLTGVQADHMTGSGKSGFGIEEIRVKLRGKSLGDVTKAAVRRLRTWWLYLRYGL